MKKLPPIIEVLETMQRLFEDYPLTELEYATPFQCLIAVLMSAQTTDIQVNKVTKELFKKIRWPQDVLDMGEKKLWELIRTVGLWTSKRNNIMKTSRILVDKTESLQWTKPKGERINTAQAKKMSSEKEECIYASSKEVFQEHGYYLPDTIQWMTELPGVGVKTAKVVLYVLYRQNRIAVDTHVHRVMNRLWYIDTKYPDKSSDLLEEMIPDSHKGIAHHSIIYFGRYLCKAKKPECERCPLQEVCKWYKENGI